MPIGLAVTVNPEGSIEFDELVLFCSLIVTGAAVWEMAVVVLD